MALFRSLYRCVMCCQMALFRSLRGGPAPIGANYRPPQRRYGRTVLLSTEAEPERQSSQQLQRDGRAGRQSAATTGTSQPALLAVLLLLLLTITGGRRDL